MIVLTFDTDYMTAEDLRRFADEYAFPGTGTFFLWQPMRGLTLGDHELGLHPFLGENAPWMDTVDAMIRDGGRDVYSVRPHSCAYSHMLGIHLAKRNVRCISQATSLFTTGLRAQRQPWGLWELPIYYMESMDFTFSYNWPELRHEPFDASVIDKSLTEPGLYVYDFHPLHVAMNTSSFTQYQSVRDDVVSGRVSPFDVNFPGRGSRTFFLELIERMERSGTQSVTCRDATSAAERGDRSAARAFEPASG